VSHCPKCQSTNLRRSPTRNRWERWRKEITGRRPYRCRACQWRGWLAAALADIDPLRANGPATIPEPPNLRGTLLARQRRRSRLDLKDLDQFDEVPNKDKA
jgi:hypothetical protein